LLWKEGKLVKGEDGSCGKDGGTEDAFEDFGACHDGVAERGGGRHVIEEWMELELGIT
jgi:hypothetical protein